MSINPQPSYFYSFVKNLVNGNFFLDSHLHENILKALKTPAKQQS